MPIEPLDPNGVPTNISKRCPVRCLAMHDSDEVTDVEDWRVLVILVILGANLARQFTMLEQFERIFRVRENTHKRGISFPLLARFRFFVAHIAAGSMRRCP